ncbi:xanthine dehydrogenase D subunit [Amycolatopsis bartoniae]|uniref:Carbon-monoxide dehydrogenase large subunit n=1 Tax=Amycolatopsis bartoniae TaxID=941986 RepID=A0A8H9IUR4_9PSEU|nr:xanthine dehydrogenase subunit D [Amycolatopsis bartoniae]MBB2935965.1 xanthine dehydrogenase D subunit [Amycolatopsis bartoniae]TVT00459.1 xanthine dehydrogenase subunit D [Amycolatopsis bartoniae]GHF63131.1 carbon-monoxide dehydrogenase large subunit [Amycolatopsis bartoniae]
MTTTEQTTASGIGSSPRRPDGIVKVRGEFAYSSDLWHEDMLWGATLRSPHPYARITGIDLTEALAVPGVQAVLTHEDVPGVNRYGLDHPDQPVLAVDVVRYQGEPVALVAADHPETARRAMKRIKVSYEVLEPVTDAEKAVSGEAPELHPGGNVVRYVPIRHGNPDARAEVVVTGTYEVGMQDQAFLGPESGLAVPAEDGGIDLYVATQWLHVDQRQVVAALGLPEEKVRLTLAGVGGAFGGREDLSMQVHACLLALHTGKPIKMVYNREESFYGHVHRHPATLHYEHGADRDGRLVYVKARIFLDGGAYASSTPAVVGNAATLGVGPYEVDNVQIDCWGTYTNNPPCGAMRGFGAVQAAFAYESQMDKLAEACGLDPVEVRVRNAMHEGSVLPTGQVVDSAAPVVELLRRLAAKPLPSEPAGERDLRTLPGGVSNTTHGEGVVRGVGYAVGLKNICFSEGFDDYSTARVRLEVVGGEAAATVQTAACEVGQGLVTVLQQIARTELGVEQVTILPMDTSIGSAGSTSASRQTYVTGGAVRAACLAVRQALFARVEHPSANLSLVGGKLVSTQDGVLADLVDVLGDTTIDETVEWRHRPTETLDPETGAGNAHVQYGFAAHRAVVDVDVELGLVKVVALDCAQDVGKALNPQAVLGQIHGGSAQGLGLAVMEEIQTRDGKIRNPSFTDYLIPTVLDMPPMSVDVLELADPHAPYGLRGVGEPPTISSTPAIVAAIRAATGKALNRVPVRPEHIV